MKNAWRVYSAADPLPSEGLRAGGVEAARAALCELRGRTLAQAKAWGDALPQGWAVPYATERNPPLWELGHVAWFQEWWIARNRERHRGHRADPDHARLPSVLAGADALYDSGRVAHASRWSLALPDLDGTLAYLARTHADTLALLDGLAASSAEPDADALYFFRLVALHEAMHAEAADYMARGLGLAWPDAADPPTSAPTGATAELDLPGGTWKLGARSPGFAFDNELGEHDVPVAAGSIDAEPVSWARLVAFVEHGGYEDARWWSPEGLAWLERQAIRLPRHLRHAGGGWQVRRGGRWHALDPREAATHISLHEAEAWCRWAGRALPTEAQWECAALTLPGFRWGHAWEWTATRFEPFPGFEPHPYRDYSAPWFGTRRVLRGAAPATSPFLAHPRYRNFFEPHRADIFAGFRTVGSRGGAAGV